MKKKKLINNNSPVTSVILSVIIGIASLIILTFISAVILTKYDIMPENLKYFWFGISSVSGLITGIATGRLIKRKILLYTELASLILIIIIELLLFIFSSFKPELSILILIPFTSALSIIGSIISSNIN